MELSCQLEELGARLSMEWAPREVNVEADRLSNGDYSGFIEENRIPMQMEDIKWTVLDRFMRLGAEFASEQENRPKLTLKPSKRVKLRERELW